MQSRQGSFGLKRSLRAAILPTSWNGKKLTPLWKAFLIYLFAQVLVLTGTHAEAQTGKSDQTAAAKAETASKTSSEKSNKAISESKKSDTKKSKAKGKKGGKVFAEFETNQGNFTAELFAEKAPKTVANFVGLADGTKEWKDPSSGKMQKGVPFYNGKIFHRVIANFMIQGGCPKGDGTGNPVTPFEDEFDPSLTHEPFTLSMANAGPKTNGSQFFITVAKTTHLNNRHSVFGRITKGEDVVMKISKLRTRPGDRPTEDVVMKKVTIVHE